MCYQHFDQAIGWLKKYMELWQADNEAEPNEEVRQCQLFIQLCEGAKAEKEAKK